MIKTEISSEDLAEIEKICRARTESYQVVTRAKTLKLRHEGKGQWQRDCEYTRHGTLTLLAGIDLQTGIAIPLVHERHNSSVFIEWLEKVDSMYPAGDKIRLILDNLPIHTSAQVKAYLETKNDRFKFVYTPKHGSWLNIIESFFSKMTKQMLRGIRVENKEELKSRIYKYFDEINKEPVVFRWTYKMKDIELSSSDESPNTCRTLY